MTALRSIAVVLFVSIWATAVHAHHSFTVLFDPSKTIAIEGAVTDFEFIAPHSYIHIDVTDANGARSVWELETTSPGQLIRAGLTPERLKPGDRITAVGNPARDGRQLMRLRTITLPGGEEKQIQ